MAGNAQCSVWASSVPPDRSPRGRGVTVQTWGRGPRGGLRGEAGRTGGLGQAPRWLRPSGLTGASCGRRRQKPGVEGPGPQPSWPCAPLPGGGLPPSSPSHPVCAWLGCRHTAPAASPVPARASVWVSGEAWGGPVWEPLPSFRAGDQPGAESPRLRTWSPRPCPRRGSADSGGVSAKWGWPAESRWSSRASRTPGGFPGLVHSIRGVHAPYSTPTDGPFGWAVNCRLAGVSGCPQALAVCPSRWGSGRPLGSLLAGVPRPGGFLSVPPRAVSLPDPEAPSCPW